MYIADLIKKECWDSMVVKGRGIVGFHADLEVHNFPLRERTLEYINKQDAIKERRRIEIAELLVGTSEVLPGSTRIEIAELLVGTSEVLVPALR